MHPLRISVLFVFAGATSLSGIEEGKSLCPHRIASLMTVPGNADALISAQRVEIRQCPGAAASLSGWIQIVAWKKGMWKPSLILNAEDSGFYQLAMIEGVYVFELMGGIAQQVLAIVYTDGEPKLALNTSSRGEISLETSSSKIIVEVPGRTPDDAKRYEFSRTDSGAGRD